MSKQTVCYSLPESTVDDFENKHRSFHGNKSEYMDIILRPALECIGRYGMDGYASRLRSQKTDAIRASDKALKGIGRIEKRIEKLEQLLKRERNG